MATIISGITKVNFMPRKISNSKKYTTSDNAPAKYAAPNIEIKLVMKSDATDSQIICATDNSRCTRTFGYSELLCIDSQRAFNRIERNLSNCWITASAGKTFALTNAAINLTLPPAPIKIGIPAMTANTPKIIS